ncbi:hypothetical protein H0H93_005772 [Arthromyces matolae]|nr:hypothetical protein H0H93_005772 [Arthromyces matolae]
MSFRALFYAYVLGGITFIPLVLAGIIFFTLYTSIPVKSVNSAKKPTPILEVQNGTTTEVDATTIPIETDDTPRTRKGWLTMRRTFEESTTDGGYVTIMRSFLDARSKDPKRSRPKDMWYVVLKGTVLYLYEDEEMTECEAAIELGGHKVVVYPEGLLDGELFTRRNAICLKPKKKDDEEHVPMPSVTKEMKLDVEDVEEKEETRSTSTKRQEKDRSKTLEIEKAKQAAREEAFDPTTPWFIFVRSCTEMEDWYLALIHASANPSKTPTLAPLHPVFLPSDMHYLVSNLDEQPDVIPTRLEHYIIGRLMKKLSKVKKPTFLTDIAVTEVVVGNKTPTLSKPMLKELTKEGDASVEVHFHYKGEFRITIEATATISLGAFKSYTVKLALAAVLKELEGNLLIKVKRPPSSRIWYAFTQVPRMVLEVEPIVSDRQITWSMILSTIEARLKEIVLESVVMPNMDDISFFDSSKFEHRGGIYRDASRHQKPPPPLPETAVTDEAHPTSSSPTPDSDTSPAAETSSQSVQPANELIDSDVVESTQLPSADIQSDVSADRNTSGKQQRSWFASVRSEGSTRKGFSFVHDKEETDEELLRGRATESDKASITSSRSRSTPLDPSSTEFEGYGLEPEEEFPNAYLSPHVSRRSSSQHSSKREHTKSLSTDSAKSAPDLEAVHKVTNSTSPNSASSFLSTLKSRAGDKQALSNTAKEAIRKWGVNWGSRKTSHSDDTPDSGSIGSTIGARLRPDSTFNVASKARASYAEVRAAVAERKGRVISTNETGEMPSRSPSPSRATLPVPIPEGRKNKARSASVDSELGPADTLSLSHPETSALSTSAKSTSSASSQRQPITEPVASRKSSPSMSRTTTQEEVVAPTQQSKPIHVLQPTSRTMTIPGIHASHRGEVMSIGYVAPPPPPPTVNTSEGKPSSIYRLFKNTTSAGSNSGTGLGSAPQTPPPASTSTLQSSPEEMSGTSDEVQPHKESSIPSQLSHDVTEDRATGSGTDVPNLPRVPPPLPPRSPQVRPQVRATGAQEALKSIATKDEQRRSSSYENVFTAVSPHTMNSTGDSASIPNDPDTATLPMSDEDPLSMPTTHKQPPPLPPRRPHALPEA